jgi:HSP20 family protein
MNFPVLSRKSESQEPETTKRFRRPFYDVLERNDNYEIRVVMPGVSKDGVRVAQHGRFLEIEGTRHHQPKENWRPILSELNWDDYRLTLELNVPVDEAAIGAHLEDGVLQVSVPKSEEAKPKKIEVS